MPVETDVDTGESVEVVDDPPFMYAATGAPSPRRRSSILGSLPQRVWSSIRRKRNNNNNSSSSSRPTSPTSPTSPTPLTPPTPTPKKVYKLDEDYLHPKVHPVNLPMWNPFNLWDYISFSWINKMLAVGYNRTLVRGDMIDLPETSRSKPLADKFEAALQRTRHGRFPVVRALGIAFAYPLCVTMALLLLEAAVQILSSVCLGRVIRALGGSDVTQMYLWAMALSITSIWYSTWHHVVFLWGWRLGMDMRSATIAVIFRKMLRINSEHMASISSGQLVNMVSNDVERFLQAAVFLPFIISAPLQVIVVLWLLWDYISFGALAGVGFILAMIPLHIIMGKCFSRLRQKTAERTDERIKIMNELFAGIRVVKMYAWEKPFSNLVKSLRSRELVAIRTALLLRGFNMTFYFVATSLTSFFSFLTYYLMGNTLTAEKVFTTMSLFGVLRVSAALFLPGAIQVASELKVGFERLFKFLELPDTDGTDESKAVPAGSTALVELTDVTCKWKADRVICSEVTAKAVPGEVLAIVGPVGCGKSTILMALLDELKPTTGKITLQGSISFASQEPWILSDTVRNNIIFGAEFDQAWYDTVIDHCELKTDFTLFQAGDMTEVGERGVTLSGGQKARLALARAVYAKSDIILLDDPLSAVDTRVGHRLFHRCIRTLLRPRVTLLVTHQLQFIRDADRILVLGAEGKMLGCDTYTNLLARNDPMIAQYLIPKTLAKDKKEEMIAEAGDILDEDSTDSEKEEEETATETATEKQEETTEVKELAHIAEEDDGAGAGAGAAGAGVDGTSTHANTSTVKHIANIPKGRSSIALYKTPNANASTKTTALVNEPSKLNSDNEKGEKSESGGEGEKKAETGKLMQAEKLQEGVVSGATYKAYLDAMGGWGPGCLILIMCIIAQGASVMADWFLSYWTNLNASNHGDDRYIFIYMGIIIVVIIAAACRTVYVFYCCNRASQDLHDQAFSAVLHTYMRFFDTNPVGRIVNRFSKDLGMIDDTLPWTLLDFFQLSFVVLGIILLVSIVNPWLFIILVPIVPYFLYLRGYYACSAREIKRIEGAARSPIYSHFMACLTGLPTIRAFRSQRRFLSEQCAHQDEHTLTYFMFIASSRWIGFRLDGLSSLFTVATVFVAVAARNSLNPSTVGLSLVYSLQLAAMFQWCVRQSTEVETLMTSVERVNEYSHLPLEEGESNPDKDLETVDSSKRPTEDWPSDGAVSFEDMSLSYESRAVLKHITMNINPREKIGIIGRTGAGKSSLIAALYRMYPRTGDIVIDGQGTAEMSLQRLRSSISVIPQDPVIFSGSVRRNLDPFGTCNDEQLWSALRDVQLYSVIQSLEGGLDASMASAGMLSVGQRQLLCLARAILRPTKILLLDEATANVDSHTDHLIQQTIKEKFVNVTVLTIAHRLHTVMHSDRLAVLDAGQLVEYDSPMVLQGKRGGVFASMLARAQAHMERVRRRSDEAEKETPQ